MLSVKKCNEILNKEQIIFSEKEIEVIRSLFYEFAEMDVEHFYRVQGEKKIKEDGKSNINDKSKFG